ncbi:MAG: transcriptional repressor [Chitinophagales bacterium]|nr:transcriptional repressor [Chitinophagales bacterium]
MVAVLEQFHYIINVMQEDIQKKLEKHHLRKTNMRREVLELFLQSKGKALSNRDIEQALKSADRITLYRTLKTFEEKGLIHQAVDNSGTAKYALCRDDCTVHEHHHEHAHFHCTNCDETICLEGAINPQVKVPTGFVVEQTHLVLEGVCEKCG